MLIRVPDRSNKRHLPDELRYENAWQAFPLSLHSIAQAPSSATPSILASLGARLFTLFTAAAKLKSGPCEHAFASTSNVVVVVRVFDVDVLVVVIDVVVVLVVAVFVVLVFVVVVLVVTGPFVVVCPYARVVVVVMVVTVTVVDVTVVAVAVVTVVLETVVLVLVTVVCVVVVPVNVVTVVLVVDVVTVAEDVVVDAVVVEVRVEVVSRDVSRTQSARVLFHVLFAFHVCDTSQLPSPL